MVEVTICSKTNENQGFKEGEPFKTKMLKIGITKRS